MAQASPESVLSHWSKLFEGLQASTQEFYQSVDEAIARRQIPGAKTSRVDWHEGGVLTAKREYLRVMRGRYMFDICAAPFGNGFFVSWWHAQAVSPLGPLALALLMLYGLGGIAFSFKKFGFFLGFFVAIVGLPLLFWLFTRAMNWLREGRREGWDDALVAMPILGPVYERIFRPQTYYKIDTYLMFQSAVHAAVLEVVDQLTTAKGLRALAESERKPVMREFYQK